jgi:hypothetical protein
MLIRGYAVISVSLFSTEAQLRWVQSERNLQAGLTMLREEEPLR